jgi:hypothetical protein
MVALNYKIVQNGKKHAVVETRTELVLGTFSSIQEAKKLQKHLNYGGCFDGNTPTFFVKNVPSCINKM